MEALKNIPPFFIIIGFKNVWECLCELEVHPEKKWYEEGKRNK